MTRFYFWTKLGAKLGLLAALLLPAACNFAETNVNPNSPTDAPLNTLLPGAQANLIYGIGGDISQFNGILNQHITGIGNVYLNVARYDFNPNLTGRVWDTNLYPNSMVDLNTLMQKATQTNSPYYRGIGRIMMATALGQTVDLYNNVPYSQAFQGQRTDPNFTPAYDPAPALYDTIQSLLRRGIADLQATSSTLVPGRDDLVYGGNRARWTLAARALQARFFNHLSKVNATQSATNALAALSAGTFASSADDARILFSASPGTLQATGPWASFLPTAFGDDNIRLSSNFIQLLQGLNDPRLPFYALPRPAAAGGGFGGTAPGGVDPQTSRVGPTYRNLDAPTYFITFVEVKFIEAEANFRLGNLAAAATAYNQAVRASILRVTGAANPTYEAANASATAATISLNQIFTQKYIALFLEPESWTDTRRSITAATPRGIPALVVPQNNVTNGALPRRWPYPQSEIAFNGANVSAQGSASITDLIFWDR